MSASDSNQPQYFMSAQNNALIAPMSFPPPFLPPPPPNLLHCPPPPVNVHQTAPIQNTTYAPIQNSFIVPNTNAIFIPPPMNVPPPVLRLPSNNVGSRLPNSLNNTLPPSPNTFTPVSTSNYSNTLIPPSSFNNSSTALVNLNNSFVASSNSNNSLPLPGVSTFPTISTATYQTKDTSVVNQMVQDNFHLTPNLFAPPYPIPAMVQPVDHNNYDEQSDNTSSTDKKLKDLLEVFSKQRITKSHPKTTTITVAEYTSSVKKCFRILVKLSVLKCELSSSIYVEERQWNQKIKSVVRLQNELCEIISQVSDAKQVDIILAKLERIKKKRYRLKKCKQERQSMREIKLDERSKLHAKIDQWHEVLKEKDIQSKRDAEIKKDANYILAEVRKKIDEAKRTLEKLKVLDKLRHIRKENAAKKGLLILPKYDRDFQSKVSNMRELMMRQLSDYEAEERAMKVMLDIEQEGQREEETKWRIQKLKKSLETKHGKIQSALFGDSVTPEPHDERFLFHNFYDAANTNLQNLIQIRHEWDRFLVAPDDKEGSLISQKWIVPDLPSSEIWHTALQQE